MGAQAPICIAAEANLTLTLKINPCHALHTHGFIVLLLPQYCLALLLLWPCMRVRSFQMPATLRWRSAPPAVSRSICGLIWSYPRRIRRKLAVHIAWFKIATYPVFSSIYSLQSQNRFQRSDLPSALLHYPLLRGCNCPHGRPQSFPKATR
jgi:hypothetical protein